MRLLSFAVLALLALLCPPAGAAAPADLFAEGYRHLTGQGTPRDATRAAQLFADAALAGESQAQFQLGALFMDGLGVPRDPVWAVFWLDRSLASPDLPPEAGRQAQARLDALRKELTPDQKRRLGPAAAR